MSQYESQYIDVNGLTLHVKVAGNDDGKLVILLHGFPEFWYGWRHQMDVLRDAGYKVVVPDQRGYNDSGKPEGPGEYHIDKLRDDVIGIINYFNAQKAVLIGHDWGGAVAWHVAGTHPDKVDKIIPINMPNPAVIPDVMKRHPTQILRSIYILFFQVPRLPEELLSMNHHLILKQALTQTSNADTFSHVELNEYLNAWAKENALTSMLNWYRGAPGSMSVFNKKVEVPVKMIWGVKDQFLSRKLAEESFDLVDSGSIIWIENATHWVIHEQPDMVNRHLLRFLKDE